MDKKTNNDAESKAVEYDVCMTCLDVHGVPHVDAKGEPLSLWGRVNWMTANPTKLRSFKPREASNIG